MPTIVIAALNGNANEQNHNEFLTITPYQSSWLASIMYLIIPIGCLLSGPLTDPFGRKRSMILMNIPFAIGWAMLYQATAIWQIFVGFAMLGLGNGLVESPFLTYVAEVSDASVRGILVAYSGVFAVVGTIVAFTLNTLMPWRSVALVCLAVPVISAITLCFVPETPQWLLSKNRPKDAERSLCYLRGWVSSETPTIAQEFTELQRNIERSNSCESCIKQDLKCSHPLPTLRDKLVELKRKSTLKPFAILIPLFFIFEFNGTLSMRPFIVQIFDAYQSPIASDKATAILSSIDAVSQILFMCLIQFSTKRVLYFASGLGLFITTLIITCYGFIQLPSGFNSFDQSNQSTHLDNPNLAYIPMICLFSWSFFSYCAIASVPPILMSELFPLKSRGVAVGISGSLVYGFAFVTKKTYYNLETTLSLPGVSLFYCGITGVGLVLMYFILPATEGRTLEDIERHFSDNSKKLTNWNIAKSYSLEKCTGADDVESPKKSAASAKNGKNENSVRNDNEMVGKSFDINSFVVDSMINS